MDIKPPSTWELFKTLNNEELTPLVGYLKETSTEGLTLTSAYKKHEPNHSKYISEIYDEICLFGGNTFVNLFRGEGPAYFEVLKDAAEKIGVKGVKSLSDIELEESMIQCILRKALKKASTEEKENIEELLRKAGLKEKSYHAFMSGAALSGLVGAAIYRSVMQQVAVTVASAVSKQVLGHALKGGAGFVVGRAGGALLGPVGWVITGLWAAFDVSGPAYRVTVPCTLHVAMLRQAWICKQESDSMEHVFND